MEPLSYMTRYNILTLICTEHYGAIVLHDTLQYPDTDMYRTLWSHCPTWHVTISWHWYVPNIMEPLSYMTRCNILTLICTEHYGAIVLHDTLQYPDTDMYRTLWSHCPTWHVTISWHWYVPKIMEPLSYMTRYNILTLICTELYEAIVLHDTLQYPDTDVYQTLWSHCSTWHVTISWRWCVPNIMKPLSYMTRYNIMTLMCTKHYEAIVLHDTLQYPDADVYQIIWSHCPTWHVTISRCWYVPNIMNTFFNMTPFKQIYTKHCEAIVQHDISKYHDADVYQTLWSLCSIWQHSIQICTRHYETTVLHDISKYHDVDVHQILWSPCSTMLPPNVLTTMMCTKYYLCNVLHDTFQYRYIPNIMNRISYMTPYNILTLMCTKHYEAIVLHDTLKYHDTDVYQTLWSHCSTWHVTISWHWYVPNIMNSLFYMTRCNIMTLICTKHYEFIVLHDTLQYPDADMYQTLWRHCSTWHLAISWHWCVPSIMKPLFCMTRYNILTLICTKHYEFIVLHTR